MSVAPPIKKQLEPGYFFSPGFYMGYWKNIILRNFSPKQVAFHGKLKQHREVWIGAHLAAAKTSLSGIPFFVALPDSDPPDVLVGAFEQVKVKSGRMGQNLNWFPVEITRCDEASGETLLSQILKKNKQAYENMILVVYLQGASKIPDLSELSVHIKALEKVYPREIIVIAELNAKANKVAVGTFGFAQVYPHHGTHVVPRDDSSAYFMDPNILTVTGRGVESSSVSLGRIELMPPSIP